MNDSSPDVSPLYPASAPCGSRLRIGLLLDRPIVPAWIARIVDEIQGSGFARIELVIVNAQDEARHAHGFLHDAYTRLEIKLRRRRNSPFLEHDLTSALTGATWMHVVPTCVGGKSSLSAADLDKARSERLDVLLRFGFWGELDSDVISLAQHGIWSHAHGNSPEAGGSADFFRGIQRGDPVSTTELLQWMPGTTTPRLLYRSHGATHPNSLEITQQAACWKASSFIMRCLRGLAMTGQLPRREPWLQSSPKGEPPGTLQMARFLARSVSRDATAWMGNRVSSEYWSILWRRATLPLDPDHPDFGGAHALPCPRGHFYADPFLFRHGEEDWLFLEDYDYSAGKADIVAMRLGGDGPVGPAHAALRLEQHLSYPFVFEWNGETYLMPEIGDTGGPVRLFRARRFPDDWECVCDLLSGHRAVDATLHEHAGRWYLFVNLCETPGGSENDELFLFSAETPLGPFQPHPANPVVSDVRSARPAGRLFRHAGRWVRPSQDCAGGYGSAVVFNEVLELDPLNYSERILGRLAPPAKPGLAGCHTYAVQGNLEVIDLKHRLSRFATRD